MPGETPFSMTRDLCGTQLGLGWEKPLQDKPGRGGLLEGVGSMQLTSPERDWRGDFTRPSLVFCCLESCV